MRIIAIAEEIRISTQSKYRNVLDVKSKEKTAYYQQW